MSRLETQLEDETIMDDLDIDRVISDVFDSPALIALIHEVIYNRLSFEESGIILDSIVARAKEELKHE